VGSDIGAPFWRRLPPAGRPNSGTHFRLQSGQNFGEDDKGLSIAQGSARQISSANNIKQMVLAMHNSESANGAFPAAAIYDKNDKPLLSWRVAILPYVEHQELYDAFHLDEPWDSAHNKKLLDKMPAIYMIPPTDGKEPKEKPTKTHYRVFHGKMAAFEGTTGLKVGDFTDGTSNTIMVVEAEEAVPWTKPEELPFDPKKDLPKLGLKDAEKFNAGFADGSVRVLDKKIDKDTLKAYITRNGGEVINE
jgi:prepilin-type processing-associated H-X9-DG protein